MSEDPTVDVDTYQHVYHSNPLQQPAPGYTLTPVEDLQVAEQYKYWDGDNGGGPTAEHMENWPDAVTTRSSLHSANVSYVEPHPCSLTEVRFHHMEVVQWENAVRHMALSVGVQPVLIPKTAKQAYECDNSDLWKQGFVEEFATLDTPMGKDKTKCIELVHKRG